MARIKAKDLDVEKKLGKKDLKQVHGGLSLSPKLIPVPEGRASKHGFDPGPVGSKGIVDPIFKIGKAGGSKGIVDPIFKIGKSGK